MWFRHIYIAIANLKVGFPEIYSTKTFSRISIFGVRVPNDTKNSYREAKVICKYFQTGARFGRSIESTKIHG